MAYQKPDDAEQWLREHDPEFGKGEYPYLSERQVGIRKVKETSVRPNTMDRVDFSNVNTGNYGTRGQIRIFQKDRHRRGQRDTEIN